MILETIALAGTIGAAVLSLRPYFNIRNKFKILDPFFHEDQLMDLRVWDRKQHGCDIDEQELPDQLMDLRVWDRKQHGCDIDEQELPAPKYKIEEPYKPIQVVLDRPTLDRMSEEMFGKPMTKAEASIAYDLAQQYYTEQSYGGKILNEHMKLLSAPNNDSV